MNVRTLRALFVFATVIAVLSFGLAAPANADSGLTISGRVFLGTTATPASPGDVVVEFTKAGTLHQAADQVPVDSTGHYEIPNVLDQTAYNVRFAYTGTAGYSSSYYLTDSTVTVPQQSIRLFGQSLTAQDMTLLKPGSISGHVDLAVAGTAAGSGEVIAYVSVSNGAEFGPESAGSPTDSSGNFSIPALPPSTQYSLRFAYKGSKHVQGGYYFQGSTTQGRTATVAVNGVVGPTAVNVVLPPMVSISGHVYLGTTAQHATAGQVTASLSYWDDAAHEFVSSGLTATTDANGGFVFPYVLTTQFTLSFSGTTDGAFGAASLAESFSELGRTGLDITLAPVYSVSGHVYLGDTAHPAGPGQVQVTVRDFTGWLVATVLTTAGGLYIVPGLRPVQYVVRYHYLGAEDYPDKNSAGLRLVSSVTGIDATLQLNSVITGTVRNTASTPIGGVAVTATLVLVGGAHGQSATATSGPDGTYRITSLQPGNYEVGFTAPGGTYLDQSWQFEDRYYQPDLVDATAGGTVGGIDAYLSQPAAITGLVSGDVMPSDFVNGYVGVEVQVYDATSSSWTGTGDVYPVAANGTFTISRLTEDRYKLDFFYDGPRGTANTISSVINVTEGQTASGVNGSIAISQPRAGSLVKTANSSSIYLVDGAHNLVFLASFASATDAGFSTMYSVVPDAVVTSRSIDPKPLSNVLQCGTDFYLASKGNIWKIAPDVVVGIRVTALSSSTCDPLTLGDPNISTLIQGGLFASTTTGPYYSIGHDGAKHLMSRFAVSASIALGFSTANFLVSQYYLDTLPTGNPIIGPATLVKSPSSSTIYLTDGYDRKVRVASFSTVSDLGLSTNYVTVPQAYLDSLQTATTSLTNAINCSTNNSAFVGASGQLWAVKSSAVANLPQTVLEKSTCTQFTNYGPSILSTLFLRSPDGWIYYVDASGHKRVIYSMATLGQLSAPDAPLFLNVGAVYLSTLPSGQGMLPIGNLVKASDSATVYLADGFTKLIPIASFQTASDASIPTGFITVPPSEIAGDTVAPGVLTNVLVCGGLTYFAGSSKIWPVASSIVAALPSTTLSDATCASLVHATQSINHALFVIAPEGGTIWEVTPIGTRRAAYTFASIASLSAPDPIIYLTVSTGFLQSLPQGPELLVSGMLVKSATNATVYLYDGSSGLIPLATFASVADTGLPTSFVIAAQSTLDALTVYPSVFENIVTCAGQRYVAGQGNIWPLGSVGANLPASELPDTLCALLPKSATSLPASVFVKSPSNDIIYLLGAGDRQPVGSWDVLMRLSGGAPTWLTVNEEWLGTVPVGPVLR